VISTTPWPRREWKDTVIVPARPAGDCLDAKLRLAVRFDDAGREGQIAAGGKVPSATQSGGWLVHCHILDHARLGMATWIDVSEP
jgi:FtsP/CotA-like multicopper oxidase with cupredoxin domain